MYVKLLTMYFAPPRRSNVSSTMYSRQWIRIAFRYIINFDDQQWTHTACSTVAWSSTESDSKWDVMT